MAVLFEMQGAVAVLTLNDPDRRNALSRAIVSGMFDALHEARAAKARAIVIAANGPAFCAGANIADLRDGWMEGKEPATDPIRLFRTLTEEPLIVIGAIHGPAVGGGFELSLSCDLVVASEKTWFSLPELEHGVIPNTAAARLAQVIGIRHAMELIFTRRRVQAAEAQILRLVNEIAPADEVTHAAIKLAQNIIEHAPPGAIAVAKRALRSHTQINWDKVASSLLDVPSGEWQEGLNAYIERRQPDYESFWRTAE